MKARFAVLVIVAALALVASARAHAGDAERGESLFAGKQCVKCHVSRTAGSASGPALEELRREQGQLELAGRLWNHVPAMLSRLGAEGVSWPSFTAGEMDDLMVYLGAEANRDPKPDPGKGQVLLVRKGCLKCHSLRQEGGPVRPDLAEHRSDYESPAAWAATMWTHTPRMAEAARLRGMSYPRFSGDEMVHLLALLRKAAVQPASAPRRP